MPRDRYTRSVHATELGEHLRQEKELDEFAQNLHETMDDSTDQVVATDNHRRAARFEQKPKHRA